MDGNVEPRMTTGRGPCDAWMGHVWPYRLDKRWRAPSMETKMIEGSKTYLYTSLTILCRQGTELKDKSSYTIELCGQQDGEYFSRTP